jgi:hypothetical protein
MSDSSRIEIITKLLIDELERQGYNLKYTDDMCGLEVVLFTGSGKLKLMNDIAGWKIDCGKYEHKVEDKK